MCGLRTGWDEIPEPLERLRQAAATEDAVGEADAVKDTVADELELSRAPGFWPERRANGGQAE